MSCENCDEVHCVCPDGHGWAQFPEEKLNSIIASAKAGLGHVRLRADVAAGNVCLPCYRGDAPFEVDGHWYHYGGVLQCSARKWLERKP